MSDLSWFLIGGAVAWTPAFLVLAIMLWRESGVNEDQQ